MKTVLHVPIEGHVDGEGRKQLTAVLGVGGSDKGAQGKVGPAGWGRTYVIFYQLEHHAKEERLHMEVPGIWDMQRVCFDTHKFSIYTYSCCCDVKDRASTNERTLLVGRKRHQASQGMEVPTRAIFSPRP